MKINRLLLLVMPSFLLATSLNEVIQDALYTNPQIKVKKEVVNTQVQELKGLKGNGYLPSIDLYFAIGPEVTKTPANNGEKASLTRQEVSITLKENLFAGFSTKSEVKRKNFLVLSSKNDAQTVASDFAYDAISTYIEVLKQSKLYSIAQETTKTYEEYVAKIKERFDAGLEVHSNYIQTVARLENVKNLELMAKQDYQTAVYQLQRLLPKLQDPSKFEDPILHKLPSSKIEDLIKLAWVSNPKILKQQNIIDAQQESVRTSKSGYYPTVDLVLKAYNNKNVGGVGYSTPENPNPIDTDEGYNALLVVNYNLFKGLSTDAAVESAKHKVLKEQESLRDTKLYIQSSLKIAFDKYKTLQKRYEIVKRYLEASKQTRSDYLDEYELGGRTITDILGVESEYDSAKNLEVTLKYDQMKSYYELLYHTGLLLSEMNIVVEQ